MQSPSPVALKALAAALIFPALLTGCGGGGGSESVATPAAAAPPVAAATPPAEPASQAVAPVTAAEVTDGDPDAIALANQVSLLSFPKNDDGSPVDANPTTSVNDFTPPAAVVVAAATDTAPISNTLTAKAAGVWAAAESSSVTGLRSGDGVSTTASRAADFAAPQYGMFYGYRQAREDWAGLAARVAKEPAIANWVKGEAGRVDTWMARNFERADLIGGWMHDLVDPTTGIPVTWSPTMPEPAAGSTTQTAKFKAAWVAYARSNNIVQMQAAARLYKLTGNTKYAQWVAGQLDFYAANYNKWPLQTMIGRAKLFAQGLDEATHAFALLDAARLLEGYVTSSRSAQWRDGLFRPMADNLRYPLTLMNNIALWQKSAMASIAMRYNDSALLQEALNGKAGIREILANGVTADNLWIEGSFTYNNYVINALSQLFVRSSLEGYDTTFSEVKATALKMLLAPIDYAFDNGTLPNPSDNTSVQAPISVPAHWQLARVVPTYWGLARAAAVRNWDGLLDPQAAASGTEPALPTATTRNYPALRQAVLRAGSWQAYIHYGQVDANHYQEELLNFEVHHGKTPISVDPGTVSYGSPYSSNYFRKGPANNVPLINGVGQPKMAAGNIVSFSATENRLVVEQPTYQPDAKVTRGYRLTTSGFAEQTRMTITTGVSKRLGVTFNTKCAVKPAAGLKAASAPALPAVAAFGYWKNVISYGGSSVWQAELNCDGQRYSLTVKGPANQNVYFGKVPDVPLPAERQGIYYEVNAADAQFEAEITALN